MSYVPFKVGSQFKNLKKKKKTWKRKTKETEAKIKLTNLYSLEFKII